MKAEQLKELFQDKDFVNKVKSLHTSEELIALFKEKDVEITKEDLIALRNSNHAELTDEELGNVAGGYSWDEFWNDVLTVAQIAEIFGAF